MNNNGYKEKRLIFRSYQVIWYVLGVFETLLIFRFFFKLSGASTASAFVRFVYNLSMPLVAPFVGIYPVSSVERSVFEWITLIAMLVWAILAYGLIYLLQFIKPADKDNVEEVVDNP